MNKKRIKLLWLSMFAPISTASSGGSQTFNYYFKRFVNDSNFEVRIITCGKYNEHLDVERELIDIKHDVIYWNSPDENKLHKIINIESKFNPFNKNANLISNTAKKDILKYLSEYKEEGFIPDFIILEWTELVVLSGKVKKIFPNCKIVASEHDVTYIGYKRKMDYYRGISKYKWKWKYWWEKRIELAALKKCDLILPHNSDNKESLVMDGISEEKIQGLVPFYKNMSKCIRSSNRRDILFFGAMGRMENHLSAMWFIQNVMPLLENLNIRFVILGSNPLNELKDLESNRIHVTGFVDNIQPYFEKSMCLVAPLVLGAGIKIKVLEAMSSGIPVLTNSIGIEGIPAIKGKHYFFCEHPEEYAYCIKNIFNNNIDLQEMEQQSKEFVKKHFSPENSFQAYKNRLVEMRKLGNDNN